MSDEIQPALEPKEWASRTVDLCGNWVQAREDAGELSLDWQLVGEEMVRVDPVQRHGLAALCLYGQPFGFTQEDVEVAEMGAVDTMAAHGEFCISADKCSCSATSDRLSALAAKIAALLPPEA